MALNISAAEPHRAMVDVVCTALAFNETFHLINLDTGSLDCTGVAGCDANGTDIILGNGLAALASSADGSRVLLARTAGGGTPLPAGVLDLNANTLVQGFPCDCNDAAFSGNGTAMAANFAVLNSSANLKGLMAFEPYADSGAHSLHNVFGEKLNAAGSLLFVPQDSGVDIFDTHTGRLDLHVALPITIPANSGAMVLDETGTKIFLTSTTGIAIAQLDALPLTLGTVTPAPAHRVHLCFCKGAIFRMGPQ